MTNREEAEKIAKWAETIARPHSDTTLLKGILHAILAITEPQEDIIYKNAPQGLEDIEEDPSYIPEKDPGNFNYEEEYDSSLGLRGDPIKSYTQADLTAAGKKGAAVFARELISLIDRQRTRGYSEHAILIKVGEKLLAKDTIR
jgi:hypothetical protein